MPGWFSSQSHRALKGRSIATLVFPPSAHLAHRQTPTRIWMFPRRNSLTAFHPLVHSVASPLRRRPHDRHATPLHFCGKPLWILCARSAFFTEESPESLIFQSPLRFSKDTPLTAGPETRRSSTVFLNLHSSGDDYGLYLYPKIKKR
jgi:hypothetical protein